MGETIWDYPCLALFRSPKSDIAPKGEADASPNRSGLIQKLSMGDSCLQLYSFPTGVGGLEFLISKVASEKKQWSEMRSSSATNCI